MCPKIAYTYRIYHGSQLVKSVKLQSNYEKFALKFININLFAPNAPKNKDLGLMTFTIKWWEKDWKNQKIQMSK